MKREPALQDNDFMQLFWAPAVFSTRRVFQAFLSQGFEGYKEVAPIIWATKQPAESVAQLFVTHTARPGLVMSENMRPRVCPQCGQQKVLWGFERTPMQLKREALPTGTDIVESHEWFGSEGWYAYKEILVSNRVAGVILDNGWQGVNLKVVELV
jgi:hypothetical protein